MSDKSTNIAWMRRNPDPSRWTAAGAKALLASVDELRATLLILHRTDMPDGPCWCSVAPNNVVGPQHERRCVAARAALA